MKTKILALFVVLLSILSSCENKMDEYYETPNWLKGNAWQVLESKGNFKIFLAAVERSSKDLKYKDLVQGRGIITIMAPTDEAFQTYLTEKGYSSIDAIDQNLLDKIVGYHLLYYSFSPSALIDYAPKGSGSINEMPGMYFKFRTKSTDGVIEMNDITNNNVTRKVIRKERFLPVFSFNYFNSFELNAKTDYEYFYPNSTWTGSESFNVSNASVIPASDNMIALITDNGYAYMIDQVLEPLETIYNEVKSNPDYSSFLSSYDRFVQFNYDEASTIAYQGTDSLFVQYHQGLMAIGSEWTTGSNLPSATDYMQIANLSSIAYTLLAPDNTAMQNFFNKYWAPYYTSLDKVNFEPIRYFLSNHVADGLLFPTQLESGQFKTIEGSAININRNDPKLKKICVNGALYGLKDVYTPAFFEKVTAPMFQDPKYDYFLNMITSNTLGMLITDAAHFKVFYPSNDMIVQNTLIDGRIISYENRNPNKYGEQYLLVEGDDGLPIVMSTTRKSSLSNSHVAIEQLSSRGDEAIYRTPISYNYIYTKGDKVYSSGLFNIAGATGGDNIPTAEKINGSWTNGDAYALTGATASGLFPEYRQFKNVVGLPIGFPAEWEYFKYLVDASALAVSSPPFSFLQGERYIVLIPTNAALEPGLVSGKIPLSPSEAVVSFVKPYFIKVNESNLLEYPFPGSGVNTELVSFGRNSSGETVKFKLSDDGTNLYVEDVKGNKVKINTYFPQIYADCAVYMIDGILEIE